MSCHGAAPIGLEGLEGALGREGKLRCPEECLGTIFGGLLDTGLLFGDGLLFDTGLFLGSGDLLRDRDPRLERDLCLRSVNHFGCFDVSSLANVISASAWVQLALTSGTWTCAQRHLQAFRQSLSTPSASDLVRLLDDDLE